MKGGRAEQVGCDSQYQHAVFAFTQATAAVAAQFTRVERYAHTGAKIRGMAENGRHSWVGDSMACSLVAASVCYY